MRTALILLLLCASVGAEDAPEQKYYAQISTSQTLPQRLVPQLRDIARKLDAETVIGSPDKSGNVGCSVIVKVRDTRTIADLVQVLQTTIAATDAFSDSSGFTARMVLMRQPPR